VVGKVAIFVEDPMNTPGELVGADVTATHAVPAEFATYSFSNFTSLANVAYVLPATTVGAAPMSAAVA
jgi:hypothetical protein